MMTRLLTATVVNCHNPTHQQSKYFIADKLLKYYSQMCFNFSEMYLSSQHILNYTIILKQLQRRVSFYVRNVILLCLKVFILLETCMVLAMTAAANARPRMTAAPISQHRYPTINTTFSTQKIKLNRLSQQLLMQHWDLNIILLHSSILGYVMWVRLFAKSEYSLQLFYMIRRDSYCFTFNLQSEHLVLFTRLRIYDAKMVENANMKQGNALPYRLLYSNQRVRGMDNVQSEQSSRIIISDKGSHSGNAVEDTQSREGSSSEETSSMPR